MWLRSNQLRQGKTCIVAPLLHGQLAYTGSTRGVASPNRPGGPASRIWRRMARLFRVMTANDPNKLRRIVVDRLESLQQAGVLQLPKLRSVTPKFCGISDPPRETEDAPAESKRESVKKEVVPAPTNNPSAK